MHNTFSFPRFSVFARKFSKEHLRPYLLYTVSFFSIVFVMQALFILGALQGPYPHEPISAIYVFSLLLGSGLFASNYYAFFQNKAKTIQFINLPVSSFEKTLLGFIVTQVIFFAVFMLVFMGINRLMCAGYTAFHTLPKNISTRSLSRFVAEPVDTGSPFNKLMLIVAFVISAMAYFGSLLFEKNAFLKTTLCIVGFTIAVLYFNQYSMQAMIPVESMPGGEFFNRNVRIGRTYDDIKGFIYLPDTWREAISWLLPGILYLFFWTASYHKLKEKQV